VTKASEFISVDLTKEMKLHAQERIERQPTSRNSITNGNGKYGGALGVEAILVTYPKSILRDTYDYDVSIEDVTLEIKTTERTVQPKEDYYGHVSGYNTTQKADFYVFISLLAKMKAYVVGYLAPTEFYNKFAEFSQKGVAHSKGYISHCDEWRARICDMHTPKNLFSW
jgi:hypothetical protein